MWHEPRIQRWTEDDLLALLGSSESMRLEFKSGKILDQPTTNKEKIAATLSKEVSAFANTEGGTLIIGISEAEQGRNRTKVADKLTGVDPNAVGREWLQQIIESNVHPRLGNIRIQTVPLSGEQATKVAYVVTVPAGTTAYQASDKLYYGRSEFECSALFDHDIRVRMQRGKTPQAAMEFIAAVTLTAEEIKARDIEKLENKISPPPRDMSGFLDSPNSYSPEDAEFAESLATRRSMRRGQYDELQQIRDELERVKNKLYTIDEFHIQTYITNTGEITLRDFIISFAFETNGQILAPAEAVSANTEYFVRFNKGQFSQQEQSQGSNVSVTTYPELKLFPGLRTIFPSGEWILQFDRTACLEISAVVHWTIYLDDAPPIRGNFDLSQILMTPSRSPS